MPGFFEGMRRMLVGEPVYKPGDVDESPAFEENKKEEVAALHDAQAESAVHDQSMDDKQNPPEAIIERFECYIHDEKHMEVNLRIKNMSKELLWMDKVLLFGQHFNLNRELDPNEEREFMVYNGPMLDNKFYTHAELHYRTPAGDYFSAMHNIEFQEKPNHKYVPHRMHFYGPVKDI
jgi:hypothetical protein